MKIWISRDVSGKFIGFPLVWSERPVRLGGGLFVPGRLFSDVKRGECAEFDIRRVKKGGKKK